MDKIRRKVVLHGPSSLSISLPSSWVKKNGVIRGGEVDISEYEGALMVRPAHRATSVKSARISYSSISKEAFGDILQSLHYRGFDELLVEYDDKKKLNDVLKLMDELYLGYEIIATGAYAATLRRIATPDDNQLDTLLRRMFRITIEYSEKVLQMLEDSKTMAESCLLYNDSIKRLASFCKSIALSSHKEDSYFTCTLISSLNYISSRLSRFTEEFSLSEDDLPQDVIEAYAKIAQALFDIYSLYYDFSPEKYSKLRSSVDEINRVVSLMNNHLGPSRFTIDTFSHITETFAELLPSIVALRYQYDKIDM